MNRETVISYVRKYQYVLLVLLVGVLLLAWPTSEKTAEKTGGNAANEAVSFDLTALEKELAQTLSQIQGVGKTTVLLTLSDGGRRMLAQNEDIGETNRETTTVILSGGAREQSVVTVELIYPTFQGALVVCDGGGSSAVRLAVVQAVEALTGLQAGQISVCARSGGS